MTLAFSTHFPDKKGTLSLKPTYFIDKIWYGFLFRKDDLCDENQKYHIQYIEKFKDNWDSREFHFTEKYEKLHTIREDKSNRWKAGNDIHPVINNRTPQRFQFAPTIKCISVQLIWIQTFKKRILVENYLNDDKTIPDNSYWKELQADEVFNLIKNDGFDSEEDFWLYFDKSFAGKIIHWTNLKY